MNKTALYAFYGTLRKGMENYNLFEKGMEYAATCVIPQFKLYSLGDYPYAVKTGNNEDTIIVDLFKVSQETAQVINAMEIEAGYYCDEITIDGISYGIYLFSSAQYGDPEIFSGDWAKFMDGI